jgi:hypothetical protein
MMVPNQDQRLHFPATARNREPIAEVLQQWLPKEGTILEIASGSGEHAVEFQQRFPHLRWQASDPDPQHRASINAWIKHTGQSKSMAKALDLDVTQQPWKLPKDIQISLSAIVCINLLHISSENCTVAVLEEAAEQLSANAPLMIYGPFKRNGAHTSESNASFDTSLRARNSIWGVRDIEWIQTLITKLPLKLMECKSMPSNNQMLILIHE